MPRAAADKEGSGHAGAAWSPTPVLSDERPRCPCRLPPTEALLHANPPKPGRELRLRGVRPVTPRYREWRPRVQPRRRAPEPCAVPRGLWLVQPGLQASVPPPVSGHRIVSRQSSGGAAGPGLAGPLTTPQQHWGLRLPGLSGPGQPWGGCEAPAGPSCCNPQPLKGRE